MKKAVLIMAGGRGERFWPLGHENLPKQFLAITGTKTLIEETIERMDGIVDSKNIFIITGKKYETLFDKYLPNFPKENIIFEPVGRDTAGAVGFGSEVIKRRLGESVIFVSGADYFIKDTDAFQKSIEAGMKFAAENNTLVTIGIAPSRPETGYGYVEFMKEIASFNEVGIREVTAFKEKPDFEKAKAFVADGKHYWNSGMFIWKTSTIEEAMKTHAPDVFEVVSAVGQAHENGNMAEVEKLFPTLRKVSIDFGVMEKASNVVCVCATFDWDDVGSFTAFLRTHEKDEKGSVGEGKVFIYESESTVGVSRSDRLLVLAGLKDIIAVQTEGVTLVYPKGKDAIIKEVRNVLRENGYENLL